MPEPFVTTGEPLMYRLEFVEEYVSAMWIQELLLVFQATGVVR